MSIYREENRYDGSIINRGMTVEDWRRLHGRVVPNLLSLEEFKAAVVDGKVHDAYLAKDLHKIMQEMRDILKEHGELREAASLPLSGRKAELGKAAAAAVRLVDGGPPAFSVVAGPLPHRHTGQGPSTASRSPPRLGMEGTTEAMELPGRWSDSPTIDTSPTDGVRAPHPSLQATPGKAGNRAPPFTDHILDSSTAPGGADPLAVDTIPARTFEASATGLENSPRPRASNNRTWQMNAELSRTVAQNASRERSPHRALCGAAGEADGTACGIAERVQSIALSSATLQQVVGMGSGAPSSVGPSTGVKNELAVLNERSPPFFQILGVIRRFQLRYGSHPLRFEIPVQYAQTVATRRVRVHVIPLRHPNVPSRWPVAKEIVVYVNDQCVTTPWRRSWPDRKEEVAKTYLPLDITQLLNRNRPQQLMQVDVFNKDYFTPALLAVVQPFSLEEVVEAILERELGVSQRSRLQSRLLADPSASSPSSSASRIADNDVAVARFYQRVMEDDVDDGLEVDDPVVTTKCPISQMPIEIPVRGRQCGHLQCVDLQSYLVSCHKGCYWNCALCDRELRPTAITIDTVLWRFLLRSAASADGGGASVPHYLRLSVSSEAAPGKYFWHPSRAGNGEADVLVDDDDDDGDTAAEAKEDENEQAVAKQEQQEYLLGHADTHTEAHDAPHSLPILAGGAKRPREPSLPVPEGSFDNPIEL